MMNSTTLTSQRAIRTLCATVTLLVLGHVNLVGAQALADEDPHAKHRGMMNMKSETTAEPATVKLYDGVLLTQDDERVSFVNDVIADRIVVMDFVYTTCTTVCPVLSAILGQVQERLSDQLGPELHLVSVSVDPVRDTPARLKAYAASHRAGPAWIWVTGEKTEVDEVLRGLGAYTPDFEDHPSMVLVGDARSGTWKRFFGFPGPDKIVAAVEELQAARQVAKTQ